MTGTNTRIESRSKRGRWFSTIQREIAVWSHEDPAGWLLAFGMLLFALFIVSTMSIIQRRAYSALPWGDMWDYWIWYLKPRPNLFVKLFILHNEHRILVARLFFLTDHILFHGRAIFIFVSIFVIQLSHATLLCRLAWLANPYRKALAIFTGCAAFICLFSVEQCTNFTWSFQIQFVCVYFAITGALASLMVFARFSAGELPPGERRRRLWLACTIVVGIIATYSMANGLLVWPLLLLAAFWFGLPRQPKLVLLAASVATWAFYLWGYKVPPQTSSIREGFHRLPQSFAFAMCVLGSPLHDFVFETDRVFSIGGEKAQLISTAICGLVGFVGAGFLWLWFVRNRRETNPSRGSYPAPAAVSGRNWLSDRARTGEWSTRRRSSLQVYNSSAALLVLYSVPIFFLNREDV